MVHQCNTGTAHRNGIRAQSSRLQMVTFGATGKCLKRAQFFKNRNNRHSGSDPPLTPAIRHERAFVLGDHIALGAGTGHAPNGG